MTTAGETAALTGFDALIEAFQIFRKYRHRSSSPTFCEHDTLYVCVKYSAVSDEDKARLEILGFDENAEDDGFLSFQWGSA
ncbi:hypothetical protein [Frankia sp. AgW1.1]|uniref:hypothetical protein n=1 Tax=Frankia sp. AgW1.1 TaxID=1836971 RepID=UPI0019348C1B|nr:hypothetical protein [Frankia sp. AgW1.1]MBL7487034.1 hypothetical protein [Frankia sp. AgW1.1]